MIDRIISKIDELIDTQGAACASTPIIIAIDGRCASGKSTLADHLKEHYEDATVIRMDHFFLQPYQRTEERSLEPGGNVDRERFLEEVLKPLKKGENLSYKPFDCKTMTFAEEVIVLKRKITIIEGSYSCHPDLAEYYDLKIFLNIDEAEQLKRIEKRNGQNTFMFKEKWIPLEEKYFEAFKISENSDIYWENGLLFPV
ncbi:MAG: hypothetical protein FWE02_07680 [Defluviitaleaceae bacterium]|nr:hypothetical protein [Defluviitaleaceae bacterium]